ncbi:O-antigen ligase family protein [Aeromicrobium sp.]|nr:O-antigen ligase family protein [Candidatus Saccharibacteria bacterium]
MTTSQLKATHSKIPRLIALSMASIIIVMPFHAFLTVWLSSIFGHYTLLRLWKELLLVALVVKVLYILALDTSLRHKFVTSRLNQLILVYVVLTFIWGSIELLLDTVTPKAFGYGLLSNLRFLAFFLVVWVGASKAPQAFTSWPKWVLWPLVVVIVLGLLQYFALPYDFLKHFGYSDQTIFPYETINNDVNHLRVFATLRGANPLGAYLVLVLSILLAVWRQRLKGWRAVVLFGATAVLFLTFSRSAWIGLALSMAVIAWVSWKSERAKRLGLGLVAVVLIAIAGFGFALRNNTTVQNIAFHTNEKSTIATSSNDGHASALKAGLKDIASAPLGKGIGSAGPASVYNDGKSRIAENYFIQVGQEVGWVGMLLFLAITSYLAYELWRRRDDSLALGLLAALVGLSFVNLLSHAWTDDTLAYLFWGLAAVALANKPMKQVQ